MSNIKSSKKHAIKSQKLRMINASRKTMIRTLIKKVNSAIFIKDKVLSQQLWVQLQSILDKFSRKGLIHKNKAARYKSKFYFKIKSLPESY
ncbi:30S ribosomal protein S20 [Buchnera aphidicola]|uniref:30S ribosomal protein S20 n=1 Tax=Buchnera aphidicola TaxID=9 RepID=UPI0034647201